ncbi:amino acid adenylation domain-containing protein [Streptomyces sp. JB150]|uniref:amino acid adenylation domain-containing protein n=1 Tax=Streptomyces sp. JB150 TaxID=2714844 RepID=UPI00140872F2|nr:amino acid adenylation domain-containing protein [Streptomyces sp. JB150]QIJ65461.1 amino acid adenylation domain-containing protein [Streptomyces sp. JB150]
MLRLWSKQPGFRLDMALSGGPTVSLACDAEPGDAFLDRARRIEEQLTQPLAARSAQATEPSESDPAALACRVTDHGPSLTIVWELAHDLFPAGLPDDLTAVHATLLDRLAREPEAWVAPRRPASLPAWQIAERTDANDTAQDIPAETLCGLVEAQAARTPDAVAALAEEGGLTYRQVVTSARRLARRLVALGAGPGQLVGVVVDKDLTQVPSVLGVTLSRAAYLPIDPQWPAARRAQLTEQGGVRIVVTTPRLREELEWPAGLHLVTLDDPEVRVADSGPLETAPTPDDLAYVIFTSGSTGQPKGVVIDHRGAANTLQDINRRFAVGPADRVLALSSLSFDLSVYDVFGALAAGAAVVLPSPRRAHDPEHWSELVERHGVTVWNSVPALLRLWLDAPTPAPAAAPLRLVLLSGDWIPVSLPDALRTPYPNAQVISLGGATEASIWSVHYPIGEVPAEWNRIPYGKPLANQTLHVLDHALDPCPVWTTGEIYIGGIGVAKGYWADPVRTGERFIVHPRTGERLYRTGDLGRYLPGGDIEFLGREDTQVKVNGYRIELDEIAAALRRRSGVREALVTVDTNPATNRGQLVAYLVPEDAPDTACGPLDSASSWPVVLDAASSELRRATAELAPATETFRGLWHRLEALAPTVMARGLARLGAFTTPGETATADTIVDRGGVRPLYLGLIGQWMAVLARRGTLTATGRPGEYRADRPLDADALDRDIDAVLGSLTATGADRVLLDYFTASIEHQLALLQGRVRPLQLLLPGGEWHVTEALYAANPAARLQNRIAAQAVRSFVERFPADREVRVLELGAGTGATADQVLPALPAERVAYHFTDLSTAFTEQARKRYESRHPFVRYSLLDIDEDPAGQGFPPGCADVVVAANVLHDAKDLTRTLQHVRGLLAPGGLLVMIEGTVNSPLNMISFAFLEGFGNYQDQREAPLLSVPEWREQLTAAGFPQFASVPEGEPAMDALVQHVLIAGAPSGQTVLDTTVLHKELGDLLPDYMVPHHYLVLDELPLSANGKVDRSALPSPWRELTPKEVTLPQSELEQRLLAIWSDALGRDDFGIEDNFFDLGGDSLHAVRMVGRFRTELGIEQTDDETIELLFAAPTVRELAAALAGATEARG